MQGKKTKTQKQTYIQNEVYFMKEYLEESEKGTREKQDSGNFGISCSALLKPALCKFLGR